MGTIINEPSLMLNSQYWEIENSERFVFDFPIKLRSAYLPVVAWLIPNFQWICVTHSISVIIIYMYTFP